MYNYFIIDPTLGVNQSNINKHMTASQSFSFSKQKSQTAYSLDENNKGRILTSHIHQIKINQHISANQMVGRSIVHLMWCRVQRSQQAKHHFHDFVTPINIFLQKIQKKKYVKKIVIYKLCFLISTMPPILYQNVHSIFK